MLTFFIWGAVLYFKERTPPADATEVYVVAKQWMWKIEHMEGQREINELHVPVGQNVKLIMTSQDVIHSFFVPAFRIKQDVLPGRYTTLWFKATKPGRYHLFCAEYCGTQHSGMGGDIVVMEPQDYAQWMAGGPAAPLQDTGKAVVCAARMRDLSSFGRPGTRPQSGGHLQQAGPARRRTHRDCRRELCARVDPESDRKDRERIQTGDADVSGNRQRRAIERAGGLRQIVSQPATGTAALQSAACRVPGTTPEYAGAIAMASTVIPANQAPATRRTISITDTGLSPGC